MQLINVGRTQCLFVVNLKYVNTILPSDVSELHGFHIKCYRRFTASFETSRKLLNQYVDDNGGTNDGQSTPTPKYIPNETDNTKRFTRISSLITKTDSRT